MKDNFKNKQWAQKAIQHSSPDFREVFSIFSWKFWNGSTIKQIQITDKLCAFFEDAHYKERLSNTVLNISPINSAQLAKVPFEQKLLGLIWLWGWLSHLNKTQGPIRRCRWHLFPTEHFSQLHLSFKMEFTVLFLIFLCSSSMSEVHRKLKQMTITTFFFLIKGKKQVSSLTCVNKSSFWRSSRLSFGVQVSAKLKKSHLSLSPSSACIFSFLPFKVLPVTLACRKTIMVSAVFSILQPVKLYRKCQYLLKIKENIYTVYISNSLNMFCLACGDKYRQNYLVTELVR